MLRTTTLALALVAHLGAQQLAPRSETGASSATPASSDAATASYSLFGDSCGPQCASLNGKGGSGRTGALPNEYGYGHRFRSAATIVGFQLFTRAASTASASTLCAVYREGSPGTPATGSVARGAMTVGPKLQFYTVWLDGEVDVKAGESLWISQYDTANVLAAALTTGTAPALRTFWRRPAGGASAWSPTGIIRFPSWRILCKGDHAFHNFGEPRIGGRIGCNLKGAMPNSVAALVIGASSPGAQLPGLCTRIYASFDLAVLARTDASGNASLGVRVPTDPKLDGATFYNQFWTLRGAAVEGSNGGRGDIGAARSKRCQFTVTGAPKPVSCRTCDLFKKGGKFCIGVCTTNAHCPPVRAGVLSVPCPGGGGGSCDVPVTSDGCTDCPTGFVGYAPPQRMSVVLNGRTYEAVYYAPLP